MSVATYNQEFQQVTLAAAIVDNASFPTVVIDTDGVNFVTILVMLGATDIAMTALKLQESDSSGSGFTDVDGYDFATDGTLPTALDDGGIFAFDVDCRGDRKRYLDVVATAGDGTAGTFASIVAIKARKVESPTTAAERGLVSQLPA